MLNRFVAKWLREQAQGAVLQGLQGVGSADSEDEPGAVEQTSVDIVLFFATRHQAAGLTDLLRHVKVSECHGFVERVGSVADRRVAIIEAQLPHEPLALVVRDVLQLRQPRWVVASGFAMALSPQVAPGHLLVSNRLMDSKGYSLGINTKMSAAKGLHVGTLLTVGEQQQAGTPEATTAADNLPLAWETQAAVIGEVCRVLKTRMMAIHAIAGTANGGESQLTKEMKSQDSIAGMLGAAAGALLEKPSSFKDLWNDKEKTLIISDRLAKFLVGVMAQLPPGAN